MEVMVMSGGLVDGAEGEPALSTASGMVMMPGRDFLRVGGDEKGGRTALMLEVMTLEGRDRAGVAVPSRVRERRLLGVKMAEAVDHAEVSRRRSGRERGRERRGGAGLRSGDAIHRSAAGLECRSSDGERPRSAIRAGGPGRDRLDPPSTRFRRRSVVGAGVQTDVTIEGVPAEQAKLKSAIVLGIPDIRRQTTHCRAKVFAQTEQA